jgi:uncharacterized protein YbaA (DUF1428 family)
MAYVDGFVITIPKKNVAAYKKMALEGKRAWMKEGALDYKECMMQDGKPKGVVFTFAKMAKAKPTDTVWFSYIVFKDKKHRDAVNKKVMKIMDAAYAEKKNQKMPFDMRRMAYAGFQGVVEA